MKLSHLSKPVTLTVEAEGSSLATLLEQGLQYVRQGLYAEGTAFFVLAREQLSYDCAYIATTLDTLIQNSTRDTVARHYNSIVTANTYCERIWEYHHCLKRLVYFRRY
jgi:hypothetical protein